MRGLLTERLIEVVKDMKILKGNLFKLGEL